MVDYNYWLIAGVILLIAEMLTTTIFLVFIALGCFASALLLAILPGQNVAAIGVCAVVSVLGAVFLRRPLQRRLLQGISLKADVGVQLQIESTIGAHQTTRVNYQGTTWQATNIHHTELKAGDRAVIVGIDGNTLLIRKSD